MLTLPSTLAKATPLTFTLDKTALLAAVSDSYWQVSANIKTVTVVYKSTAGNQRKRLVFDFTQATPTALATWTGVARSDHDIEQIILEDFDKDTYSIPSANLPSGKHVGFGGGAPIVVPTVHNYIPNDVVNDMAVSGNDLYIAGAFTKIGFYSPFAVFMDQTTAEPINRDAMFSSQFPSFNGEIECIVKDGDSTLFVGGRFTTMDGISRNRIAKLNLVGGKWISDATFNNATAGRVGFNGSTHKIIVDGDDLFVCGFFGSYTGPDGAITSRPTAVKISKVDGTIRGFNAKAYSASSSSLGSVGCYRGMILDGNYLYLAGQQSWNNPASSGSRGYNIVKVDKTTGDLAPGWPNIRIQADGTYSTMVHNLAMIGGSLYAVGYFGSGLSVDGSVTARYCVAKFNPTTGAIETGFSSPFTTQSATYYATSIVDDGAGNVIVGGRFNTPTTLGKNIVKLSASTGSRVSAFAAGDTVSSSLYSDSYVWAIEPSGSNINVFGKFEGRAVSGGSSRSIGVVKLDATSGAIITAFDSPTQGDGLGASWWGSASISNSLLVFGPSGYWGGYVRKGVAKFVKDADGNWKISEAFDTSNGGTTVNSIAISGSDIYIGGNFTSWAGSSRNRVAKLNATTGALDSMFGVGVFTSGQTTGQFNGVNQTVNKIAVNDSDVFIGGPITTYSKKSSSSGTTNVSVNYLLKVNRSTNTETVVQSPSPGTVRAMVLDGDALFVGGDLYVFKYDVSTLAGYSGYSTYTGPSNVVTFAISGSEVWVAYNNAMRRINKSTGAFIANVWNTGSTTVAPSCAVPTFMTRHSDGFVYFVSYASGGCSIRRANPSLSPPSIDLTTTWGYAGGALSVSGAGAIIGNEFIVAAGITGITNNAIIPKVLFSLKLSDGTSKSNI